MRQLRSLGTALLMVLVVLSAVAVATASAEKTLILPEPGPGVEERLEFTSTSGKGKLLTLKGKEVKCEKDTGSGIFTSPNLGTYKVLFEECKGESGTTCTGVGDKAGTILQEGTIHYVLALLSKKLVAALAGLVKEFHFTCEVIGIKILVLVRGCIAALAEPVDQAVLTKETKDLFLFSAANSGDPDILTILMENEAKEIPCTLESSIAGGAFESSALEGSATNKNFKKAKKAVEVLLMNEK